MGWSVSSDHYVENFIKNILAMLMNHEHNLKVIVKYSFPQGYRPELETSLKIDQENTSYYQKLISIINLGVDLERANVVVEV